MKKKKTHKTGSIYAAVVLIMIGIGLLLKAAGVLKNFSIFSLGALIFWFMILPPVVKMFAGTPRKSDLLVFLIGAWLLSGRISGLSGIRGYLIPVILIAAGLIFFSRSRIFKYRKINDSESGDQLLMPVYRSVFMRKNVQSYDEKFSGAIVSAICSELTLSLQNTEFSGSHILDVTAFLSSVDICIPADTEIYITGKRAAKGKRIRNIAVDSSNSFVPGSAKLFLNYRTVLGSINIRHA